MDPPVPPYLHRLRPHGAPGGRRCYDCGRAGRTGPSVARMYQEPCFGIKGTGAYNIADRRGPAVINEAGHPLMRTGPFTWCQDCGLYGDLRGLLRQCRGSHNSTRRRRLEKGQHPLTGLAIGICRSLSAEEWAGWVRHRESTRSYKAKRGPKAATPANNAGEGTRKRLAAHWLGHPDHEKEGRRRGDAWSEAIAPVITIEEDPSPAGEPDIAGSDSGSDL